MGWLSWSCWRFCGRSSSKLDLVVFCASRVKDGRQRLNRIRIYVHWDVMERDVLEGFDVVPLLRRGVVVLLVGTLKGRGLEVWIEVCSRCCYYFTARVDDGAMSLAPIIYASAALRWCSYRIPAAASKPAGAAEFTPGLTAIRRSFRTLRLMPSWQAPSCPGIEGD